MDNFSLGKIPSLIIGSGTLSRLIPLTRQFFIKKPLFITGESSLDENGTWTEIEKMFSSPSRIKIAGEPSPEIIDKTAAIAVENANDGIIGIGGGSVIDVAKAVAAMSIEKKAVINFLDSAGSLKPSGKRLPLIAVPTTSGTGSESTKNAVISKTGKGGFKKSLRHENYIPDAVIIDSSLLITVPPLIGFASGMDAFTQLLEAYVSISSNMFTDSIAMEGLVCSAKYLPLCGIHPLEHNIRLKLGYAAFLSGVSLANAGLGLVHGFSSVLGYMREIPHGIVCAAMLAETTETIINKMMKNKSIYSDSLEKYANAGSLFTEKSNQTISEGCERLVNVLKKWKKDFKIPGLKNFGFTEEEAEIVASETSLKNTPVKLDRKDIERIYLRCL